MKKLIEWFKGPKSDILLFAVALLLLNLVASKAFFRLDLTGPKSYSLSRNSIETVKNLEEPLSIKVFFSKNLPAPYNSVETYVRDILVEYKSKANKNFTCEFYDMNKAENESAARNYNLHQVQIQEVKNNEIGVKNAWMGMVLSYADRIELIDGLNSPNGLEYRITSTITKMISTSATLSGMKGNVNLSLYLSKELENFGIQGFDQIENSLTKAFEKANKNSMGRLVYEKFTPSQDEIPSIAEKYGLQALSYKDSAGNDKLAVIGAVISKDDSFRVLPVRLVSMPFFGNTIAGLDNLDAALEDSLKSLVSKTLEIGYITGHDENDIDDTETQYSLTNFVNNISDMYTFKKINLATEEIPSSIHTIVINAPRTQFSRYQLYKIDQFLMKGGSVMLLQGPYDEIEQEMSSNFMPNNEYKPRVSGMEEMVEDYGVFLESAYIYDENCYQTINQRYGKLDLFYAPLVQDESMNQKHPVSKNLGYIVFLTSGPINVDKAKENKELKTTVLAKSSPKSWLMSKNIILNPLYMAPPENKSIYKSENMAVMLEGNFTSAFDSEVKEIMSTAEENSIKETSKVSISNHIKKSVQKGKLMVISSDAAMTNQLVDEAGQSPMYLFLRNAIDYMNGQSELCAMRSKGLSMNSLKDVSSTAKNIAKAFNQYVIVVFVALAGLFVWRARSSRRKRIQAKYNPNDQRYKTED